MGAPMGLPDRTRLSAVSGGLNVLALVSDCFGGNGGIAQYNRDLMTALAASSRANRVVVLPRLGRVDGALTPGVRQLKPRRQQVAYALAAVGAALRHGPFDVVFCGHLHLSPLAAALAGLLGIPLWQQIHGLEAWEKPSRGERWAAERARLITAVSRHTRSRFLAVAAVDPSRVRVLPATVDERFSPGPKPDDLIDQYGLRGKLVLLTVSRLDGHERYKGHDKVIAALPRILEAMPDVMYLVVGVGDDRTRLQALAHSLGVEAKVLFAGNVAPDKLPQYYRLADLFVMPSTQEGFGIVFLEASWSGLGLVGGDADGSIDALADGAIGMAVDPNDAQALLRAILEGLASGPPDPSGVRRFARANFAGHVHELVRRNLLRPAEAIAG